MGDPESVPTWKRFLRQVATETEAAGTAAPKADTNNTLISTAATGSSSHSAPGDGLLLANPSAAEDGNVSRSAPQQLAQPAGGVGVGAPLESLPAPTSAPTSNNKNTASIAAPPSKPQFDANRGSAAAGGGGASSTDVVIPPEVIAAVVAIPYSKPERSSTGAVYTAARLEAVRQRAEEQALEEVAPVLLELAALRRRLLIRQSTSQRLDTQVRDQETLAEALPRLAEDLELMRAHELALQRRIAARKAGIEALEQGRVAADEAACATDTDLVRLRRELAMAERRRDALKESAETRLRSVNEEMEQLQSNANRDTVINAARLRSAQAQVQSMSEQIRILERENRDFSELCEQLLGTLENVLQTDDANPAGSARV